MSCQDSAVQAITATIVLGVIYDSLNSHVALGDANVNMDAVVL